MISGQFTRFVCELGCPFEAQGSIGDVGFVEEVEKHFRATGHQIRTVGFYVKTSFGGDRYA